MNKTHKVFCAEGGVTRRLENHDRAIYMKDGYARNGTKFDAERLGLR